MFTDDTEQIIDEIKSLLEIYTLDDILEHNDITLEEALAILVEEGKIVIPEVRPVR